MSASEIYSPAEEEAVFAEVYRAHHQKLMRYCQYRLRDRYEAEDVMQESFVRAWRTMPANAYGTNFYPWLRVVAGNLCTDVLRKRSHSEPMADIEPGTVDGGMDRITEEEDREMVRQALLRLNERHRSALMMRENEGLTYDQIAERTGVTSGTVESLLWRARQALKREFTVVAGRTGAWTPVPVLAAVVARVDGARRRATSKLLRRIPGLSRLSESPGGHLALAALATLTVVGGIAATFGVGPAPTHAAPIRQVTTPTLASATRLQQQQVVSTAAALATQEAAAVTSTSLATPAPAATPVAPPAPSPPAGLSGLRVVDPVTTGRAPARYSHTAPVGVVLGTVAVGVSPSEAAGYASGTTTRATTTGNQVLAAINVNSSTANKESNK